MSFELRLGCSRPKAERFRSGANCGTKEVAERGRQTPNGSRRFCGYLQMLLVTSARFVEWNGRRREGYDATGSPWSAANRALVTVKNHGCFR
jgi:hypothetical protein